MFLIKHARTEPLEKLLIFHPTFLNRKDSNRRNDSYGQDKFEETALGQKKRYLSFPVVFLLLS